MPLNIQPVWLLFAEKSKNPVILGNLSHHAEARSCIHFVGVKITQRTELKAIWTAIYISQSTLHAFNSSCAILTVIDIAVSALSLKSPIFRGLSLSC